MISGNIRRTGSSASEIVQEEFSIPFKLGKLVTDLKVSVVEASIPLLLGKPDLKRFGFIIDFETETVFISKTFETFGLETTLTGHLALPIKEEEHTDDSVFLRKTRSYSMAGITPPLAATQPVACSLATW